MDTKYDFSGWATRNNLKCSDGRVIRRDAFKDNNGDTVPLVWNHQHNDPFNVLGHAMLENRDDGVYAYCSFNSTEAGEAAKEMVMHGDVKSLSIYANHLQQNGANVMHGSIREVSLVLAGANPGALIDTVIAHSDGEDEEAIIYNAYPIVLEHADTNSASESESNDTGSDKTVKEIYDSLSPDKKKCVDNLLEVAVATVQGKKANLDEGVTKDSLKATFDTFTKEEKDTAYALIGVSMESVEKALAEGSEGSEDDEEDEEPMKHNLFEKESTMEENVISHSDMEEVIADARRIGSLRDSAVQHGLGDVTVLQHSVTNVGNLFPDNKNISGTPDFYKRDTDWVNVVMGGVHHTPFSRIKTMYADITADEARAKGYIKGNQKVEEVITTLKRTTDPTTIYKLQKMDRDDVLDITDFDVIAWLKKEMRMMLDEEIARAILVGDGRQSSSNDKIDELKIRPIWTDNETYTIHYTIPAQTSDADAAEAIIEASIRSRKQYKGSGNLVFFTTEDWLTEMLLLKDTIGHRLYDTEEKLATALRAKRIVTVPVMEGLTRTNTAGQTVALAGILVNLSDYNTGNDKGGEVTLFDDFDINFNKQEYLIETRLSGAMTKPKSAIALEIVQSASSAG